jgi:glycerol-3-phosphate cytidylyltransferase
MIYLPATCSIITAGHIRVLKQLARQDELIVGLLDETALKGYKECVVPFEDRKEILESINWVNKVVRQSSLNPYENLVKYGITSIASGDGWEPEELAAIKKAGCKIIDVKLKGEGKKLYSASKILNEKG